MTGTNPRTLSLPLDLRTSSPLNTRRASLGLDRPTGQAGEEEAGVMDEWRPVSRSGLPEH